MPQRVSIANVHQFARELFAAVADQNFDATQRRRLSLPGLDVEVRSQDPAYLQFCTQAFVDNAVKSQAARKVVRVAVVDHATMPELPGCLWHEAEFSIKRMVDALHNEGFQGMYELDYRLWQLYRNHDGEAVQLMVDNSAFPPWESAFPLRQFVHWAYHGTHQRLMHAGTLGHDGRGVLLAGSGGSGKSGTTLSGILNGLTTVGDDYVVVHNEGSGWRIEPVIRLMKQDAAGLDRLGLPSNGEHMRGPNWQNKFVFDYTAVHPGAATNTLDLAAILLPVITRGDTTEIVPATTREAVMALVPSSLYQLKGGWADTLKFTSQLCRMVPAYHLRLGSDPVEIANAIKGFIEGGAR